MVIGISEYPNGKTIFMRQDNNSQPTLAETIISYIENDAEIAMPVNELMHEDGTHLTKREYGKLLLKHLCIELREHFC